MLINLSILTAKLKVFFFNLCYKITIFYNFAGPQLNKGPYNFLNIFPARVLFLNITNMIKFSNINMHDAFY